jgi:plasmid stabilization system protein ParE
VDVQVIWTETATADLEAIVAHIAQTNPGTAEKLGKTIVDHVEVLRSFPRIGPRYAKARRGRIREILCGKYRIFYRVNEQLKSVEILTIWHGARDEPELP